MSDRNKSSWAPAIVMALAFTGTVLGLEYNDRQHKERAQAVASIQEEQLYDNGMDIAPEDGFTFQILPVADYGSVWGAVSSSLSLYPATPGHMSDILFYENPGHEAKVLEIVNGLQVANPDIDLDLVPQSFMLIRHGDSFLVDDCRNYVPPVWSEDDGE